MTAPKSPEEWAVRLADNNSWHHESAAYAEALEMFTAAMAQAAEQTRAAALEEAARIVAEQPFYPDTHTGMRQQWVKDEIARKLAALARTPAPSTDGQRAAVLKELDGDIDRMQDECDGSDEFGCERCLALGEVRDVLDGKRRALATATNAQRTCDVCGLVGEHNVDAHEKAGDR